MIGTISIAVEAKNPNLPLHPLRAFVNSPSSLRIINVPKKIGEWRITSVTLQAVYPDGSAQTAACVLVGGVWVGTLAGSGTAGVNENGYTVYASGVDENGLDVEGYVLGKGDVVVLEADGKIPEGAFAELSAQVQGKRDLDDLALPAQPSETVPVWYGATECAWDAETSAWTSEDGFVEVTRRGTSDEYDVVAYSQLEPVETVAVRARVRLAPPSFKAEVETAGGPVEVRSFDGFLATEEWTVQQLSSLPALSAFATKEYVDGEVSGKADVSSLTAYTTEEYVDQEVSGKADASSLSDYYLKSETSSAVEIGAALASKQDALGESRLCAIDSVGGELATVVEFEDGTLSSFDIYGTLTKEIRQSWGKEPVRVKVGTGVTALGMEAFLSCGKLAYAYMPDSVTTLSGGAFMDCSALTGLVLPRNVSKWGFSVFRDCDSLEEVVIPDGIAQISVYGFYGCESLKRVTVPANVNSIGWDTFANCTALSNVMFKDRTLAEVQAMTNYPWGLSEDAVMTLDKDVKYALVLSAESQLEDRAVQHVSLSAAAATLALPQLTQGKVTDFVLDVTNAYESGGQPAQAAFSLSGTVGVNYAVVVPQGESLADMTTIEPGGLAEFYFTRTSFQLSGLPTWKVVKQAVESWTPAQI